MAKKLVVSCGKMEVVNNLNRLDRAKLLVVFQTFMVDSKSFNEINHLTLRAVGEACGRPPRPCRSQNRRDVNPRLGGVVWLGRCSLGASVYKRPSARMDRLNMDLGDSGVPILVSGFAQSIREHEHQIADLVLSICARALTNGEVSLEQAVASIAARNSTHAIHPRDLIKSPYMTVEVLDSGLLGDLVMNRSGVPRVAGVAEKMLEDSGWREVEHWSTLSGGLRTDGKPTFHRAALWAPSRSGLHRLSGVALYRALDKALTDQALTAKLLAIPHVYWHTTLALSYLQDTRGEVFIVPAMQRASGRT